LIYRSANASLAPSAAKPPAKARRSQVIAVGRDELRQERQEARREASAGTNLARLPKPGGRIRVAAQCSSRHGVEIR
jgi:hypothetical protein